MDNVLSYIKNNMHIFPHKHQIRQEDFPRLIDKASIGAWDKICFLDRADYLKLMEEMRSISPNWLPKDPSNSREHKCFLKLKEGWVHVFTKEYYQYTNPADIFKDLLK